MKMHGAFRVIKILLLVLLAATVLGFVTMWLWNRLMPVIFGLHIIGFWQAVGLVVLSKILFGGFHGRHGCRDNWRARLIRRWEDMTPEEREKFRSRGISPAPGGTRRCGGQGFEPDAPPASESKE
jgi:hypothetical protein